MIVNRLPRAIHLLGKCYTHLLLYGQTGPVSLFPSFVYVISILVHASKVTLSKNPRSATGAERQTERSGPKTEARWSGRAVSGRAVNLAERKRAI